MLGQLAVLLLVGVDEGLLRGQRVFGDQELGDLDPFDDDGGGGGCGHGGYSPALRGEGLTAGVVERVVAG